MTRRQKLIELINQLRGGMPVIPALDRLIQTLIDEEPAAPEMDPLQEGGVYELVLRLHVTVVGVDADGRAAMLKLDQGGFNSSDDRTFAIELAEVEQSRRVG